MTFSCAHLVERYSVSHHILSMCAVIYAIGDCATVIEMSPWCCFFALSHDLSNFFHYAQLFVIIMRVSEGEKLQRIFTLGTRSIELFFQCEFSIFHNSRE